MSAKMFVFPADRRVRLVATAAAGVLKLDREKGENFLRGRLSTHATSLQRKGVAPEDIATDVGRYEAAVRAHLWRRIFEGGAS